jgi:hypothetical protein
MPSDRRVRGAGLDAKKRGRVWGSGSGARGDAGGLGQRIQIAISLFLEHQLLTLLIFIYILVTIVDYLSAYLRRKAI